ncbi:MAG: hypothetical protein GC204_13070 [Chloroflexi bacterium]|nr:hypothetical protein [Chloroflexota bacterium]
MNDNQPQYNIDLRSFAQIDTIRTEGFGNLLKELFPLSLVGEKSHLYGVYIVPHGQMEESVQQVLQMMQGEGTYHTGDYPPSGVAIPTEKDGNLYCFILIDERQLASITPEHYRQQETVSTLLEELLHVRLFGIAWERRGYLRPQNQSCQSDLKILCSNFHDEYAVCRLKTGYLGSSVPIEHEGILTTIQVVYGAPISPLIRRTSKELYQFILDGANNIITADFSYHKILNWVYRGILEPLARDAGFRAGNPSASHPNSDAIKSIFYREHILPYWKNVEELLGKSFDSEFKESDELLLQIETQVDLFLRHIGVSIKTKPDGGCWVDLDTSFFDSLNMDADF